MTILHATEPYGHYLQSYYTDEVTQRGGERFIVSHLRYRKDADKIVEIERRVDFPEGFGALQGAIDNAEAYRKSFLECDAEESAAAAEEVREQDLKFHRAGVDAALFDPFEIPSCLNTRIEYLFRGADNSKVRNFIVVAGVLTENEEQELREALSGDTFIPEQVGMLSLQGERKAYGGEAWHEIEEISISEDPTNFPGTAKELLAKFKETNWDPSVSPFEDHTPSAGIM